MSEKEINEFFTNKLRELLKQRNMSYKEFSEKINVKPSTISMWNSGRSLPRMDVIERIAQYFNVSPSYLIGWNQKVYEPTYEDIQSLVARNGKKLTLEQKQELIRTLLSEEED